MIYVYIQTSKHSASTRTCRVTGELFTSPVHEEKINPIAELKEKNVHQHGRFFGKAARHFI